MLDFWIGVGVLCMIGVPIGTMLSNGKVSFPVLLIAAGGVGLTYIL